MDMNIYGSVIGYFFNVHPWNMALVTKLKYIDQYMTYLKYFERIGNQIEPVTNDDLQYL